MDPKDSIPDHSSTYDSSNCTYDLCFSLSQQNGLSLFYELRSILELHLYQTSILISEKFLFRVNFLNCSSLLNSSAMQDTLVVWLNGCRVMQDLKLWLELCYWLRLMVIINHDHTSSDLFSNQFVIGLERLNTETNQLPSKCLISYYSVNMNRLNRYLLEIFSAIRTKQAMLVHCSYSWSNDTWQYQTNTLY